MLPIPAEIIAVFSAFESQFCKPTYLKLQIIMIGTILGRGRRTIASALRAVGLSQEENFSNYHQVLNRAKWSGLATSKILLKLICEKLGNLDNYRFGISLVIDEHLERRSGRKIKKLCSWRDPLLSNKQSISRQGLKWLTVAVVISSPWGKCKWALPFFSTIVLTKKQSEKLGKRRHKPVSKLTQQICRIVRRWLPGIAIKIVGDGAYSVIELGHCAIKAAISLIAPLRMDARLFEVPPPRLPHQAGRTRVVGAPLPKLSEVLTSTLTCWQRTTVRWYGGRTQCLDYCTGKALWYYESKKPLPIRWVLVRDPKGNLKPRAFFSTDQSASPTQLITDFVDRWLLEVTFEEARAHLGIETQRQWSDKAIERATPALFALFSLVCLFAHSLYPTNLPIYSSAWYSKSQPTFADALAAVRAAFWGNFNFPRSPFHPDQALIPLPLLQRLAVALSFSH